MNIVTVSSSQGVLTPFSDKRVVISYDGTSHNYQLYKKDPKEAEHKVVDFSERMGFNSGDIYMPDISGATGRMGLRNKFKRSVMESRILNSEKADGVTILEGESAVFAVGDCPVIVMYVPKKGFVVVAHAGRQSLLGDFTKVPRHEMMGSVVSDMVRRFSFNELRFAEVFVVLSIAGIYFEHDPDHADEKYRQVNMAMIESVSEVYGDACFVNKAKGALSIFELVKAQCKKFGIDPKKVKSDGLDTFSTKLPDGSPAFWSNRRGDTARNIVLVSMV